MTPFSNVFILNFEQVNVSWAMASLLLHVAGFNAEM